MENKRNSLILTATKIAEMQALSNQTESDVEIKYMSKFRSYECIVRCRGMATNEVYTGDFVEVLDLAIKYLGDVLTLPF